MNTALLLMCLLAADELPPEVPTQPDAALTMRIIAPQSAFVGQFVKPRLEITGPYRESEWYLTAPPGKTIEYVLSADKTKAFLTVMEEGIYAIEVITVGKERGIVRHSIQIEFTYKNAEKVAVAKKAIGPQQIDDEIKTALRAINSDTKVKDIGDLVIALRASRSVSSARAQFTKIAGPRAPQYNPWFAKLDKLFAQMKTEGLLEPEPDEAKDQKYVNALQNIATIIEGN